MFRNYNILAFLWAIIILILCGLPGKDFPKLSFLEWLSPDKIAHLVLFGIQCYLLLKGFTGQNRFPFFNTNAVALALILTISYGCIVEILQTYVFIDRSGDIRDAAANAIGAFIGLWMFKRNLNRMKTKAKLNNQIS